jgi:HEAT repeat protein
MYRSRSWGNLNLDQATTRPAEIILSRFFVIARESMAQSAVSHEELPTLIHELSCGDDERAEVAALTLGTYGCDAVAQVEPLLDDPSADRRWWAARALGQLRCDAAQLLLIRLLDDLDADVRACAAFALGEVQSDKAVLPLAQKLNDSSVYVSAMAADALARIGKASVPILIDRLRNGASLERARAAKALLTILDSRSIPALIAALDDDSPVVEHYATEALTRLGVGTVLLKPS